MATAIFYDAQNIALGKDRLPQILDRIRESPVVDKIVLQQAYLVETAGEGYADIRATIRDHGIQVVELERLMQNGRQKRNQVDLKMCVDIPAAVLNRPSITTVVVVTGDGDFRFLLETLRERGKRVVLASMRDTTSMRLIPLCDDWINLSGDAISDKALRQIWQERVPDREYNSRDFFSALVEFLEQSAEDPMLLRFLKQGAVSLNLLRMLFSSYATIPDHTLLGCKSWSELVEHTLKGTRFQVKTDASGQSVLGLEEGQGEEPGGHTMALYQSILGLDEEYSQARMKQWLKNLSRHSPRQLGELIYYMNFLWSNDLIRQSADGSPRLIPDGEYQQVLLARLRRHLRAAHCVPDEELLQELEALL